VLIIPAIDVVGGRSRIVYWPGVSTGIGAPTDRPERIAAAFVGLGTRVIHLVDVDGARAGRPVALATIGAVASTVAVPLQVAGGLEDPDAIRAVFAAGATRVVLSAAIADRPGDLAACLDVAGDWLAVGLDPRPDKLAAFPWRRPQPPTIDELVTELVAAGVERFVITHGGVMEVAERLVNDVRRTGAEALMAGGVGDLEGVRRARASGAAGLILGEALLSGAVDFAAANSVAA
jgi:phosphoribosylformimino-5-aminoimidazole carboxamide ribotide isomerase